MTYHQNNSCPECGATNFSFLQDNWNPFAIQCKDCGKIYLFDLGRYSCTEFSEVEKQPKFPKKIKAKWKKIIDR